MLSDAGKSIAVSSVPALLEHAASTFPDHNALDFFGRKLTYTELARQVDRAARGFQRLGVA
ncbi:MAG TPA: AMP-binding protein, partial [Methylovirgula sp.]